MSRAAVPVSVLACGLSSAVSALGCSNRSEPAPPPPPQSAQPQDAGVDGATIIGGYDPASGMHLDDNGTGSRSEPSRPGRLKTRAGKPIDIILKSSPPGAVAAVDGIQVGVTPTYWNGEDGREHEFTFVLRGHAVARYRFVPVTSGTVHARLEPIAEDPSDGGLGPTIAPTFVPDASVVAPPTILTPVDAAVRTTPVDANGGLPNDALPMPPEEPRSGAGPRP